MASRSHCATLLPAATLAAAVSMSVAAAPADTAGPHAATAVDANGADTFRAAALAHGATALDPDHAGIWKAATPPGDMHGEFANADPIGLAAGVSITSDCSINWVDPDSRKRYCFSSATSLVVFLEAPQAYLSRARQNWEHVLGEAAR